MELVASKPELKCPRTDISPRYDKLTNGRVVYHTKGTNSTPMF